MTDMDDSILRLTRDISIVVGQGKGSQLSQILSILHLLNNSQLSRGGLAKQREITLFKQRSFTRSATMPAMA